MSYRIDTLKNEITGATKYLCKKKGLLFWVTMRREIGWGCDTEAEFDTEKEAGEFIDEYRAKYAWERI